MALGDGVTWDETKPDNDVSISDGDDYQRHDRKAVRLRMNNEHVWASSQSATAEAGQHRYITLLATTVPSALMATTQMGGVAAVSSGSGYEVFACAVTAGTTAGADVQLTFVGGLNIGDGKIVSQSTNDGIYFDGDNWVRRANFFETLIKGWVKMNAGSEVDGFNVDSITDHGVGTWSIIWDKNFGDENYAVVVSGGNKQRVHYCDTYGAGQTSVDSYDVVQEAAEDDIAVCVIAIGDQ